MVLTCSFCEGNFSNEFEFTEHGFETCVSCGVKFKHYYSNPLFYKYHYFGYIRCFDDQDSDLIDNLFKRIPSIKDRHFPNFKKFLANEENINCYKKIVDLYGYYNGYLLSKILLPDGFLCEGCLKEFEWKKDIVHLVSALSK